MLIKYPFPHHQCAIHENIHIAYMDEGKGAHTFLFIHGLANYAPVWKYQMQGLSKTNRCIAIDLPGNGYSSRGDYPYTLFFYAESIVRFIEKMELKNVVLCGHSLGGQIALVIALRYPHLIHKLSLIASAGLEYFAKHEVMLMQGMMNLGNIFYSDEYHLELAIQQSFFSSANESETIISELKKIMQGHSAIKWKEMCNASINGMLNEQVQQFLPSLTMPTQIIFGNKDALIPNTMIHFGETPEGIAKKAAALIPNASYSIIANAGHFVQMEKWEKVNEALTSFVSTN